MPREMNSDAFINKLLELGVIIRVRRGWYLIPALSNDSSVSFDRATICRRFGIETGEGRLRFNLEALGEVLPAGRFVSSTSRRVRTISRNSYRSMPRSVAEALSRLPYDADGVRRSYGVEYEIYSLTSRQESDLAYLLDTLPPHVTERDGSLGNSGVEIIFQPMTKAELIRVVKTLGEFVVSRGVEMDGTGMHITFGVSNSTVSQSDLVIRMNRLSLAIKSVATQQALNRVFGRDFTGYARLPISLTDMTRYRAFNVRNDSAVECRLVKWNCNIEKMVELLEASMVLFTRPFEAADFIKMFEIMGSNADGR